ncbi:MAG TPA: hypothetical protein VJN69_14465 [Candidatus Acidoferrales bacterium]|nr:hypothetical protein [Candidatus Acidoferrales bacterium]
MAGDPYSAYGGSVITQTQAPASTAPVTSTQPASADPYASYGGQSSQPSADPYASYGGSVGTPQQTPATPQALKPSVWQRIKGVWDDLSTTPTPVLAARLLGPKAAAAADVIGTGLIPGAPLQSVFSHMAESQNPVTRDVGSVYSKVGDFEQGIVRSSESPIGLLSMASGTEPVQAALPTAAKVVGTATNAAFATRGVVNLSTPKQKNESDAQYAIRLGSGAAQVFIPALGMAAHLTDSNAAADAVRSQIGTPTEAEVAANAQQGRATVVDDHAATTPVISKPDILSAAVQKTLHVEGALRDAGIDPSQIRNADDAAQVLEQARNVVSSQLDPRVGATIGFSAQRQLAESLNMDVDTLLSRQSGTAFNAESAIASRAVLQASQQNLLDAAKAAANGGADEMDTALQALAQHVLIQDQVKGVASEAGRALGSFRNQQLPETRVANALSNLSNMRPSAQQKVVSLLSKLDLTDERAVNEFTQEITPSTTADKAFELYRNALLSSPKTLIVKGTSEALLLAMETASKATSGAISQLGAKIRGTQPQQYASEAMYFAKGAWDALKDFPAVLSGKLNLADMPEFERSGTRAIKGSIGDIVRVPQTVLNRETNLVWLMNYRGQLNSMAARQALSEGLQGDELAARQAYLAANPSDDMANAASRQALYGTFQRQLGKAGRATQNLINSVPGGRWLAPFFKTPANIVRTSLDYTPIALAKSAIHGDVEGAGRALLGSGIAAAIAWGTMTGKISGGLALDYRKREAQEDAGQVPYAVKVGNSWLSLHKAEPLGMILGLTSDATLALMQHGDTPSTQSRAQEAVRYIVRNLSDLPFLQTLSNFGESLSSDDPLGSAERFLRFQTGSFVPAIVRNAALINDRTYRRPQTIAQGVEQNVPGLTHNVPAVMGTDAQPVQRPESELGGINPFPISTPKDDPAANEIARLGEASIQPVKTITIDGQKVQLTPEESQALQQQDEQTFYDWMSQVVREPEYQQLDDAQKTKMAGAVRQLIGKTRAARLATLRESQNEQQ